MRLLYTIKEKVLKKNYINIKLLFIFSLKHSGDMKCQKEAKYTNVSYVAI